MTDNRKFKLTINVKKDDKTTETKEIPLEVAPEKFDKKENIEETVTYEGKTYTVKGKAYIGWFGDDITDLKIYEGTEEKNKELSPKLKAEQWRWSGLITIGSVLTVVVIGLIWWWKASKQEDKEEESL